MQWLKKIFGDENQKMLKMLEPLVARINELEPEFEKLSDDELKEKTNEFRKRLGVTHPPTPPSLTVREWGKKELLSLSGGRVIDDLLPEAFAVVREAAKRTLNQRHFDVQLMGGIALHRGGIAEMKTGEGKTLVSTLPVYLNALVGKGVHVVTVNDYLAQRDMVWMGQIFHFLGLSVGCIVHDQSFIYDPNQNLDAERDLKGSFKVVHEFLRPVTRKEAYAADITYGTNNEFGFDYLRDNMSYTVEQMSQRGHNFAIVDEIDSILIDEARTPLIISAPDEESGELYKTFSKIAPRLSLESDYTVDEKLKAVSITEPGIEKVEKILGVGDIYSEKGIKYVHQLEQALRAKVLFQRDRDYVVKSGEVIIVDEFTGRLMPGRRWSEGLHQAIEAKEGVMVQKESRTLASITFQNYFRLYRKLSGMTGTAKTSEEEFYKVYGLEVVQIPTNKPLARKDLSDKVFQSEKGKWQAIARDVRERNQKGQPVLIGTVSIEKNEMLSALLKKEGIAHEMLNAKQHEREGAIIAQAGRAGAVTVATNMAGRGVDITLGGNPPDEGQASRVKEAGGLLVIGTERHEARRIDDQLRGRSGRQGDSGESQFYVSLEDDLMRIFGSDRLKRLMGTFGIPEDEAIENNMVSRSIESAQAKIEGFHFDSRKHVLEYDDVMNKQRVALYAMRKKFLEGDDAALEEEFLNMTEKNNISDFKKVFENKKETMKDFLPQARITALRAIDLLWMEHIEAMEYVRSSVRLRAYGQRDPLIEYKNEGMHMFKTLLENVGAFVVTSVMRLGEQSIKTSPPPPLFRQERGDMNIRPTPTKASVGRNDPCPCGSGKKYKRCHGV